MGAGTHDHLSGTTDVHLSESTVDSPQDDGSVGMSSGEQQEDGQDFPPDYSEVVEHNQPDDLGTTWEETDLGEVRRSKRISMPMITISRHPHLAFMCHDSHSDWEPRSLAEALRSPEREQWEKANLSEHQSLDETMFLLLFLGPQISML